MLQIRHRFALLATVVAPRQHQPCACAAADARRRGRRSHRRRHRHHQATGSNAATPGSPSAATERRPVRHASRVRARRVRQ